MRRTYIVIAILLLILGTASTFALTYVQTELEEPWGAQYTLQYTGSSIELSNPETTINGDDSVTVQFDITPDDKDVKCKFVIKPLDVNGDTIEANAGGATTQITLNVLDASDIIVDRSTAETNDMEVTYSMVDSHMIGNLIIEWTNDGFFAEYESVEIFIEDIE